MAGAGYKLFNTGDVLTASDVNTYLQQQTVMVFANAAARTTALSSVLAEGMITYLKDTDALEIYSGAAWVGYGSGDITAVTTGATSGLTGGATSGAADIKMNFAAKGGLFAGTGAGTAGELTLGTNGYVLTADSSQSNGIKWAAVASSNKLIQVVEGTYAVETGSTSSTYADTGLTVTITPTLSTSKVLILVSQSLGYYTSASEECNVKWQLLRGATSIVAADYAVVGTFTAVSGSGRLASYNNIVKLDSPATTSATTYKTQFARRTGANSTVYSQFGSAPGSIVAIEIGA